MPGNPSEPERFLATSRAAWRAWLQANHVRRSGIWLVTYKKSSGLPVLDYDEAVEEALCFGWVDSKSAKLDDQRSMLWMAPRNPRSSWSRTNKQRVERLMAAGLMAPAGLAKVDAAKVNGAWTALDAVEDLIVPPDLARAMAATGQAAAHFDAFPRSVKRSILAWIASAKRPETRSKRIDETARLAAENQRANQ